MGTNNNPAFNSPFVSIKGRPEAYEASIRRQGQSTRLLLAKKCPCLKNGKTSIYCNICKGKGYILSFQQNMEIIEENSKHTCAGGTDKVYPFWTPVTSISKIQRFANYGPCNVGDVFYTVSSFTDSEITLVNNGNLPKPYEKIKVTYKYSLINSVTDEDSTSDGTHIIHTTGTEIDTDQERTSNPFNIHGDLVGVSRVYNVTQDITYTVLSFKKQSITLDPGDTAPLLADVLQVDYTYFKTIKMGVRGVDVRNALLKWGEDLKVGDLDVVLPGGYYTRRGSVITLLSTFLDQSDVIGRGDGTIDELPYFDVSEIVGNILDEDDVTYINGTDFELQEYNDLVWIGSSPAQGKKYTVDLRYNPSYQIYKKDTSKQNSEDQRFPQNLLLRKFNRFTTKELNLL